MACIFMFVDHIGYGLIHNYLLAHAMDLMPEQYKDLNTLYEILHGIGRLAFPIFAFFIVEGFHRTRSVVKYAIRMLLFGIVSEIPFDIGLFRKVFYWEHQNIMFTFFIAILMLSTLKWLESNIWGLSNGVVYFAIVCTIIAFSDAAIMMNMDYSWKCMLLVSVLYFARSCAPLKLIAGAAATSWEKYAPISFILLYFYDPEKPPKYKYAFYLFYPLNFILIYLVARVVL